MIGHENLLTADILDADPNYAEKLCELAATVAQEDVSWDFPRGPRWSWAWRRSLKYGIAVPAHLIESNLGQIPTKKQLLERLQGWHAAIQDMMRLRAKFVHPTASAVPVVEQTDMSSLAIARSEH